MAKEKTTIWLLLIVLGGLSLCYAVNIGYLPLWDPDEPYYIESAREMVESGDLITPYFNYEPRLNKPVFFYWLQVLSGRLFGFNELSARFPSFLAGIALLWLIYKIGSLLYDKKTGLIAMLIGATSFEIYVLSRQSVTDMCLAFFMTLAIYGYVSVYKAEKNGEWYLFYIGTAFAVITKGPVGLLLPGAVVFSIMLAQRDFSLIKKLHVIKGVIIFIMIASPWYILVLIQQGFKFLRIFLIENNFLRFITPIYKHTGGIWYYIPVLLLGFFPWVIFLILSVHRHLNWMKEKKISLLGKKNPLSFSALLNIAWFAVYFIFFSISGSKLPAYILGLFPALSLFTASGLSLSHKKKTSRIFVAFHYVYLGLVVVSLMFILRYCFFQDWMLIALFFFGLSASAVLLNLFKITLFRDQMGQMHAVTFTATLITTIGLLISANFFFFPKIAEYFPLKALGGVAEKGNVESGEIIAYKYYEPSMVFYSHKKIIRIEKMEELEQLKGKGKPFFAYMTLRHFKELPQAMQSKCQVLSYGIRYKNRIKKISDLFKKSSSKTSGRGLLLVYHPGKS
jgi:4-amino-4-deoxy-L-arabinose transferase-like glycosyltransferase